MTDIERRASRIIRRPTALVKRDGYGSWRQYLNGVSAEARSQYPYGSDAIANTGELNLLIDGQNSVLDIKNLLDGQSRTTSDLQAIINYIEILRLARLVEI